MLKEHNCLYEEDWGKVKEFIETVKGHKIMFASMFGTILLQICVFLYLWGGMNEIVKKNTDYLWGDIKTGLSDNTRCIDRVMTQLEGIKIVGIREIEVPKTEFLKK